MITIRFNLLRRYSGNVWFGLRRQSQSFIVWLAARDRLSTGTRMRQWRITQVCMLCGEQDESRDHFFFECSYTFTVWKSIAGNLLGGFITPDWTVSHLTGVARNTLNGVLLRLCFQTTIYLVWRERNSRCHGGTWKPVAVIT